MSVKVNRSILKEYNSHYVPSSDAKKEMFFSVGDLVSVTYYDINDDELKKRVFRGICIARKNRINNSSFTLRSTFKLETINQTFFLASPILVDISVVQKAKKKSNFYKSYYLKTKSN